METEIPKFKPKFRTELSGECFESSVVCLSSQLAMVVVFLKDHLHAHTWYGANIGGVRKKIPKCDLSSYEVKKIGDDSDLLEYCSLFDQFIEGVFLCIDENFGSQSFQDIKVGTEDEPFREVNLKGVLLEIRAFDTSFFEIYSEKETMLKKISEKFS